MFPSQISAFAIPIVSVLSGFGLATLTSCIIGDDTRIKRLVHILVGMLTSLTVLFYFLMKV